MKKAKVLRLITFHHNISLIFYVSLNTLDKAIEAIPNFGKRIKLFTEKLRIAQYADNSIYDYRLKIPQALLHYLKLPEQFTQDDIQGYLSMLLNRHRRHSFSCIRVTNFR